MKTKGMSKPKYRWWAVVIFVTVLVLDVTTTINLGVKLLNELGKGEE